MNEPSYLLDNKYNIWQWDAISLRYSLLSGSYKDDLTFSQLDALYGPLATIVKGTVVLPPETLDVGTWVEFTMADIGDVAFGIVNCFNEDDQSYSLIVRIGRDKLRKSQ